MTQQQSAITMPCDQLAEMLRPIIQRNLQANQAGQPSTSQPAGDTTEQLLAGLQTHLATYIQGSQSIQAKGVPLPDVDEQLLPLQQQVEAVMQSVAAHRASVPAVISKALEQQLQDMRPPGCAAADDDAASPADQAPAAAAVDSAAEAAQAQQLQEELKAALNKLPALRARLEEMDGRLQHNLEAVDAARANKEQAPRTVERVLRNAAAGGGKGRRAPAADGAVEEDN